MSALDPRYLVRLDILPPVSGAPVACMCGKCGAAWTVSSSCEHFGTVGALVECLDLSPPDVVDGVPVRLDALSWALLVISRWYAIAIDDIDAIRPMDRLGVTTWDIRAFGGRCVTVLTSSDPGYEEYDADDPDQARRIVAAVLRKGRPEVRS